jgi:hypothetical protein
MPFDKTTVHELLTKLERSDPRRKVFGSRVHDYRLYPVLARSEIEDFEAKHDVSLPADYKYFITEIGNGGAGPYYGLFPFGYNDSLREFCKWSEGGLVGDLSAEFPHDDTWNLDDSFWQLMPDPGSDVSEAEEDRMMEAWNRELEEHYWNPRIMNGAIPICHLGCAIRQWLVIKGSQKGFVWTDDRADQSGVYPLRDESGKQLTFFDWYISWLKNPLIV